jgi:(p)ppGpp synthase/HD superfamily hydrolase
MPTLPLTPLEQKAWLLAQQAHQGVVRKFLRTPYFEGHVAKVFGLLKQYDTRSTLGAAAILHDTLEDVDYVTFDMIKQKFGPRVAALVRELTSDESEISKQGKANYLLNKMMYMSPDALLIKLCDRLQNISDMYAASAGFRSKYYIETRFIINGLNDNRRLTQKHSRVISQIEGMLHNIKNRNKFESVKSLTHLVLFEVFKQKNITIEDIIKCIDNGGVIFADIVKDYPDNKPEEPLTPVSIDDDGLVTVDIDGETYEVDLQDINKIDYK